MSRKYKISDQSQLYFVTFTVIHWLDVFTRQEYRDIFLDSVRYCQKNKGLEVCAYCIMSSHIHMIVGRNKEHRLDSIIRDLKKFTSTQIIRAYEPILRNVQANCSCGCLKAGFYIIRSHRIQATLRLMYNQQIIH